MTVNQLKWLRRLANTNLCAGVGFDTFPHRTATSLVVRGWAERKRGWAADEYGITPAGREALAKAIEGEKRK